METWLNRELNIPKWMYEYVQCNNVRFSKILGSSTVDRDFSHLQRPGLPTGLRHDVRIAKRWVLHMLYSDILLPEGTGSAGRPDVHHTRGDNSEIPNNMATWSWSFAGEVR